MIIFFPAISGWATTLRPPGVKGTVEEISIFNTHLKTADNRKIIVASSKILGSPIINSSAKPTRRLDLVLSISYVSNLKLAKQIILTELQNDVRVLPNPAPTRGRG